MTPDERLAVAESRVTDLREEVTMLRKDFTARVDKMQGEMTRGFDLISQKLDSIQAKVEQGKGAWWVITKMALLITGLVPIIVLIVRIVGN